MVGLRRRYLNRERRKGKAVAGGHSLRRGQGAMRMQGPGRINAEDESIALI
jgi:hypothetical protein